MVGFEKALRAVKVIKDQIQYRSQSLLNLARGYFRYVDRYFVFDVLIDNNPVILVNYYVLNVESEQLKVLDELAHIFNQLQTLENTRFSWGGDFNLFFDFDLDAKGGSPKLKIKSFSKLLSMMSQNDLCDIYRIRNPEAKRFTWRRKSPFKQRRLDCFLVSETLQENIKAVGIIPSVRSDHSAITLTLYPVSENVRGRACWKFNSSLTQDNYFIDSLKSQIPTFAREVISINDPIMRWEYVKYKCREFSRSYPIKKAKEKKITTHIAGEKNRGIRKSNLIQPQSGITQ